MRAGNTQHTIYPFLRGVEGCRGTSTRKVVGLWVETLGPSRIICTCLLVSGNKNVAFIKDSLGRCWHGAEHQSGYGYVVGEVL